MTISAGVGISNHRHSKTAAKAAINQALERLGDKKPDLVMVFASVSHTPEAFIKVINDATGSAPLVGCSGNGIVGPQYTNESNFYLGVMAIASDELHFHTACFNGLKEDSTEVGVKVGEELKPHIGDDSLCIITLVDGFSLNFERFKSGLEDFLELDTNIPILGGLAGDDWHMEGTYQYFNDKIFQDSVVAILISGDTKIAYSVNHGCVPIGDERIITKAEGNVIYEFDGKPVLDELKAYLEEKEIDDWEKAVVNIGFGFKAPKFMHDYDEYIIRFMLSRDQEAGSITIPTEVKEGDSTWVTRRDKDKISGGVDRIADDIKSQLDGAEPRLVFHFDCAGRGKMIFRDDEKTKILESLQEKIGSDTPWIGFYTYGEIGPVSGINCYHNYTLVLLAIK